MKQEIQLQNDETIEEVLFKLGSMKKSKEIDVTWDDIAQILNKAFNCVYTESFYRKKYKAIKQSMRPEPAPVLITSNLSSVVKKSVAEIEKQRIRFKSELKQYKKTLNSEALSDAFMESLEASIKKAEPLKVDIKEDSNKQKAMYVMLSDIHYGLSFDHFYSKYNPSIACARVIRYAQNIVRIAEQNNIKVCYVSLLGDMISGLAHQTIRLENVETITEQVIGVSQLVSEFLYELAEYFEIVRVNSVSGNHSRVEQSFDNSLRSERLDDLVPWYCRTRLVNVRHIEFEENAYDPTIAHFEIFGKNYVAVHGDFDLNSNASVARISELIKKRIDYFLMGHMHVAESRFEETGYIRNGAVVSGGDDYTSKKRLFAPPVQVCMIVDESGVESIYPVRL